jgi:hypothetical protein
MKQLSIIKKHIVLILLATSLFSCKNYVQVIRTAGVNTELKNNLLVYENDTLIITYSFWHEKGLMSFSIYNKLDKPIYVDWKKSSYIDNGVKLNYWRDEAITNTTFHNYYYYGPVLNPKTNTNSNKLTEINGFSHSNTLKPERITFLAPKSIFYKSSFYIYTKDYFNLNTTTEFELLPRNDDNTKKTKVYSSTFTKENTPIVFRNFITFSFNEKFENEFYVDNEFWLNQILEMDQKHFEYPLLDSDSPNGNFYIKDKNGEIKLFCDYNSGKSFYLRIPRERSIENRKTAESMNEKSNYLVEPK